MSRINIFHFLASERGAVTIDWTALTAGILLLGIAVVYGIFGGVGALATSMNSNLAAFEPVVELDAPFTEDEELVSLDRGADYGLPVSFEPGTFLLMNDGTHVLYGTDGNITEFTGGFHTTDPPQSDGSTVFRRLSDGSEIGTAVRQIDYNPTSGTGQRYDYSASGGVNLEKF